MLDYIENVKNQTITISTVFQSAFRDGSFKKKYSDLSSIGIHVDEVIKIPIIPISHTTQVVHEYNTFLKLMTIYKCDNQMKEVFLKTYVNSIECGTYDAAMRNYKIYKMIFLNSKWLHINHNGEMVISGSALEGNPMITTNNKIACLYRTIRASKIKQIRGINSGVFERLGFTIIKDPSIDLSLDLTELVLLFSMDCVVSLRPQILNIIRQNVGASGAIGSDHAAHNLASGLQE